MSSKTQNAKKAKTESAPNKLELILLILIIFFGLFSLFILGLGGRLVSSRACSGSSCVKLEHAVNQDQRRKGLSGRAGLADKSGMLFIFDKPDYQCMWMKDMKFNLDMLWLNNQGKIIKIARNVSPDTYPASFCARDAKYVIELKSGETNGLCWNLGDLVQL